MATREKVQAAIEAIAAVLNAVSTYYLSSSTAFEITGNPGGVTSLIRVLDDGLRRKGERIAAPQRGELSHDNTGRQNL